MRVLWVIHYPVFGGPHNRVLRLAPALRARGVEITVVLPDEPGNAADRLRASGVDVRVIDLHRIRASLDPRKALASIWTFAPEVRALRAIMRQESIDAVVAGGLANPHAVIAGHREGRGVVWQIIDTRTPQAYCRAMRPIVERCTDVAQFGAQSLIEQNFGEHALRCPVTVLRPSVDTSLFVASAEIRRTTRAELRIPQEAVVVGTVANVNAQKGIEWFVRAAARLHRRDPSMFFVVVGAMNPSDPYAERVQREVAERGLTDRIRFTGARADVERLYPAFDVKLITSVPRSEGTTTTAMEALACEVPVVSTDVGALREVLEHGQTGLIVPPQDDAALAGAATELILDPERRSAMGHAGRQQVVTRFSLERAATDQLAILEQAITHRRARS